MRQPVRTVVVVPQAKLDHRLEPCRTYTFSIRKWTRTYAHAIRSSGAGRSLAPTLTLHTDRAAGVSARAAAGSARQDWRGRGAALQGEYSYCVALAIAQAKFLKLVPGEVPAGVLGQGTPARNLVT
jgi:hypothetical protein